MNFRTPRTKTLAGLAGLVLVAAPIAACGSESENDSESQNQDQSSTSQSSSSTESVEAQAMVDPLTGVNTAIRLDPTFTDTLMQLGLTPAPVNDAELQDGSLIFPITGGHVSLFEPGTVPNYVVGQIQHINSGFSLSAQGGPTVQLGNFNVDPGVSKVYGDVIVDGEIAVQSAYLFRLNGSTLQPIQMQGGNVILQGSEVYISDVAADLLNETFGVDAVTDEVLVGTATITVATG